jgi:hypothetical protein
MLINKFKFRRDVQSYNLGGMGCSIGVVAIGLVRDMLQVSSGWQGKGHDQGHSLLCCRYSTALNIYQCTLSMIAVAVGPRWLAATSTMGQRHQSQLLHSSACSTACYVGLHNAAAGT